jgi:Plasmid pRiA4b ORF-3-like protein
MAEVLGLLPSKDLADSGVRPKTNRVKVGELLITTGAVMEYLFDFGDRWRFQLCLESIVPKALGTITGTIIETHGKAPEQYADWD